MNRTTLIIGMIFCCSAPIACGSSNDTATNSNGNLGADSGSHTGDAQPGSYDGSTTDPSVDHDASNGGNPTPGPGSGGGSGSGNPDPGNGSGDDGGTGMDMFDGGRRDGGRFGGDGGRPRRLPDGGQFPQRDGGQNDMRDAALDA